MSIRIAGQVVASAGSLTAHNHDAEAHPEIRALIEQGGGSSGSADVAKAVENKNEADTATQPIFHWIGTKAEHEAQNIATEHPEWLAYITDDEGTSGGGSSVSVLPATEEQAGIVALASQEEALEAFDDSKAMTPLKTAQKVYESVGRVVQLGFDGTLSGNILTFEPDIDTPYEIKNGYSYEIDLLFPAVVADGQLDENIEIVINNNGESIKIVNALHDDTSANITVGKMKQIMKYSTDIGFRWIFNARFTTTQSGDKVFVMPSTVVNVEGSGSGSVPDNVYTQDNLIAGKNVTFTKVPPEGGIDEHTLAVWHFDGDGIDVVGNKNVYPNGYNTKIYKFGTSGAKFTYGNLLLSGYSENEITLDGWFHVDTGFIWISLEGAVYQNYYLKKNGFRLYNNKITFGNFTSAGMEWTEISSVDFQIPSNEMVHLAIQRTKSTEYNVWANGIKVMEVLLDSPFSDEYVSIISSGTATNHSVDELRISDCVRYTESFTPPTKAYTVATEPSKTAVNAIIPEVDLSGKADTNLGNISENIDYVVESYNDGTNWYRVYKSGWIEQGGYVTYAEIREKISNVSFLKPFSNSSIYVSGNGISASRGGSTSWIICLGVTDITTTGFLARAFGFSEVDRSIGFTWYACGQGE